MSVELIIAKLKLVNKKSGSAKFDRDECGEIIRLIQTLSTEITELRRQLEKVSPHALS